MSWFFFLFNILFRSDLVALKLLWMMAACSMRKKRLLQLKVSSIMQGCPSENGGRSHEELLQIVQRQLCLLCLFTFFSSTWILPPDNCGNLACFRLTEEPDSKDFRVDDLVELEKDLSAALTQTRCRKVLSEMPLLAMTKSQLRSIDHCYMSSFVLILHLAKIWA